MAEALRGWEESFQKVFQEAPLGAAFLDLAGGIQESNPALSELVGSPPEELAGLWVGDLVHPMYKQQTGKMVHDLLEGARDCVQTEVGLVRKDGSLLWSKVVVFMARTRAGEADYCIAIFEESPSGGKMLDAIHLLATTDDLTGLHNRRGFFLLAEQLWRLAARKKFDLSLLYVDLDGLKGINDTFGHAAGDEAIRRTAEILRSVCRDTDVVARLGGDEFVILMVEAGEVGVELLRGRLVHALATYNAWPKHRYKLAISLGVSRFAAGEVRSLDDMLTEADRRMYEDKRRASR